MSIHLYDVGTRVYMKYSAGPALPTTRSFMVEAQMPPLGATVQYRIKSDDEAFRRVVPEHQVSLVAGDNGL